ncbi:uncharacterized protein LOC110444967 [Mizuhopecten yessoensis]|uniref:uncharacterized protein LOC110444967 n=1 Tax=Mizuhopecten yessoensis TaxID=6573 RepID=UPI000B45EF17|nr:uncharacterized protein LOC110444967 [Mizuhopecten yessoensis]
MCTIPCLNGGSCITPDVCACAPSYLGSVCELGGDPSSLLTPSHHFADERTSQPLSWYEEEPLSTFGKLCLVKIEILNADIETLLTATSYTSTGKFLGNYTVGGADAGLHITGSDRAACLEFRCPSDLNVDSIVVNITIATSQQNCHVVNDQDGYDRYGDKEVTIQVQPHRDYGSKYGIYITYGVLERMRYAGVHMCRSGTNYGGDNVVPHDGTAATFACE